MKTNTQTQTPCPPAQPNPTHLRPITHPLHPNNNQPHQRFSSIMIGVVLTPQKPTALPPAWGMDSTGWGYARSARLWFIRMLVDVVGLCVIPIAELNFDWGITYHVTRSPCDIFVRCGSDSFFSFQGALFKLFFSFIMRWRFEARVII